MTSAALSTPAEAPVDSRAHVYLIDGSGYIFRAYHALPPLSRPSDGLPVGAVHGFCQMIWKLLQDTKDAHDATHFAVIFDYSGKSFRNEIYPGVQGPPATAAGRPGATIRPDPRCRRAPSTCACIEQEGL